MIMFRVDRHFFWGGVVLAVGVAGSVVAVLGGLSGLGWVMGVVIGVGAAVLLGVGR